ncbi:MAG: MEDS domain-containing protein [Pseudonocardia sp.]
MTPSTGDVWSAPPRHTCAFPISDEQLWEMSAAWIAEGLVAGERVTYFEDGTAEAVLERLGDDRVPVDGALARGQLEIVPAAATRSVLSGSLDSGRALVRAQIAGSLADGYAGWRMTGQMNHALQAAGGVSLLQYDLALDAELTGRPGRALCLYDRRRYPDAAIREMRAAHSAEVRAPSVYDDGLLRITRSGLGAARLAGEADHSNHGMIDRLLATVLDEALRAHSGPAAVTLDLASLRFLDVAGSVALVHAAEQFPATHRLVLRGVRPRVQRVLDRCGAPFAPQLDVLARGDRAPDAGPPAEVRWAG